MNFLILLNKCCSSSTHTWDAFHLARASFELHCVQNNQVLPTDSNDDSREVGPHLLGNCLKINVDPPEMVEEDDEESSSGSLPAIKIHDDEVNLRFLVCGAPSTVVSFFEILLPGLYVLKPHFSMHFYSRKVFIKLSHTDTRTCKSMLKTSFSSVEQRKGSKHTHTHTMMRVCVIALRLNTYNRQFHMGLFLFRMSHC